MHIKIGSRKRSRMNSDPKLIDIHDATIWRGRSCVFEHLNLSIAQHERVAILGPNGSGKTTLMMTINRELYPVANETSHVRILGRDRWNVWELRKKIGLVSNDLHQRYAPTNTGLEVVVSGFHSSIGIQGTLQQLVSDEQIEKARQALMALGIAELARVELKNMSSGQQRRCLLARSLVHKPETLILDEPTAGLDFAASFDYLKRIRELALSGCSVIIVTHHLNEIPPEVDRVVLLKEGRVVADGEKTDVLTGDILSDVYETSIKVAQVDGFFLAYPGSLPPQNTKT